MRVVATAALGFKAVSGLSDQFQVASAPFIAFQVGAGLLLLVGLWTPLAGLLVVVLEGWLVFAQPHEPWPHILLATLGGALALLGPGAWSADASPSGHGSDHCLSSQLSLDLEYAPERTLCWRPGREL